MRGGAGWRWLCEVDVAGLAAALPLLEWLPARRGEYAMLETWPAAVPVDPVFARVAALYPDRHRSKTCFSRVVPGQYIEPHRDMHEGRNRFRVHVPIVTNERAWFMIEGQIIHMQAGHAYEIDPTEEHAVINFGNRDRVHLFWNMVV